MLGKIKSGYWVFIAIVVVAIATRLYDLNLEPFSAEQKASVILSISAGVLSVIGLYFLAKELFDEKIAAISSFLLAVSSWHVLLSKLGTKDIFTSVALIFAFYFIWHGLKYGHTFDLFIAGLFGGAGFSAGREYFAAPLVVLAVFCNYWDYIKKDFSLSKYEQTKTSILEGFALLVLITIGVTLPILLFIWQNPDLILSPINFVFEGESPFARMYKNLLWTTDKLLLIKFPRVSEGNLLSWPLSIFFAIGLIKELTHWLKRKHGHFSVVHTFIFSWLFIMLVPHLLSDGGPSVLGLSVILPPVIILSAKGIWWVTEKLNRWSHLALLPHYHKHYVGLDAGPFLALLALLVSIAILEISKLT